MSPENEHSCNLTIFASGTGSNFVALHRACLEGRIPARITALVTNRKDSGARHYAHQQGIRDYLVNPPPTGELQEHIGHLLSILEHEKPKLIALAGYLKKIPEPVLEAYPGKFLNIHPSLLPHYGGKGWYGMRVHQAVIDNRDRESGCSVHRVTAEYDQGPVLATAKVPVDPQDTPETLAKKVLEQEHRLYPGVVARLLASKTSCSDN